PEMKKEDIKLHVNHDVLTITGERKHEREEKNKKYHRVERSYGSFMRSFSLPEDADGTKVAAEYKDGVLKVHLPKSEKSQPKAIEVKVA
ncbi:MAG TPA: Hsp20/alpha crystallin family protein, partial [Nitrospira sp.]|nr:Hsp20/alpha crystallin family protein [Nitrospira sp.]